MMVNDARIFIILGGFHLFECSSEEMSNDGQRISQEDDTPSSVGSERPSSCRSKRNSGTGGERLARLIPRPALNIVVCGALHGASNIFQSPIG